MTELTQAQLHGLLSYDPNSGVFTWLKSTSYRVKVGDTAGSKNSNGYLLIQIDSKRYLAHRLAWLYVYGVWPKDEIDHINGARTDNRLCNLREATSSENNQNYCMRTDNTSGYVGVGWHKRDRKWQAQIQHNKKKISLGTYDTPEEAHAVYVKAKRELHTYNPTIRSITNPTCPTSLVQRPEPPCA